MSQALRKQELRGLSIAREGITLCQLFYADNTTIIIEADLGNAKACMEIRNRFDRVSRLYFKWDGMQAIYTGVLPLPPKFFGTWQELGGAWPILQTSGSTLWAGH